MATIKEIAELAKVSRGTVDRVLNQRPNVHPLTRKKVQKAIDIIGYPVTAKNNQARKRAAILIPKNWDSYFTRKIVSGIRKAFRYIGDSNFELIEQPLETMTTQELLRAMQKQIDSGVNGLIIRAENTAEIRNAMKAAVEKGIVVVTFNTDVPISGRLYYVGQDLIRAGEIAAGVLAKLIRPSEHVLVVTGNLRLETHRGRVNGFCGRLREFGFYEDSYQIIETNEMHEITRNEVERALRKDSKIRAIYMSTQPISACVEGIKCAKPSIMPYVICNDLTPTAKRYLKEGKVDFVVNQELEQESFRSIVAMYQILMHGKLPKEEVHYTNLSLICKEML